MIQRCNACNLSECAYQQVNTSGNCSIEECELLIVGDYPRQDDDITGTPLSGDQYKFLWDMLSQVGIKYQVTYLVRCIPIDKYSRRYRKPELYEYDNCIKNRLHSEIEIMQPKCILALGKDALSALTGSEDIGSYRELAHPLKVGTHSTKILATYTPGYVLRCKDEGKDMFYDRFCEDVVYACRHAAEYREAPKYKSMTISADQFCRIVDIWCNDPSIEYVGFDTESNGLSPWVEGSKITSFSVSVDGFTGYNIFLYHPELDISDDERERIRLGAQKLLTTKKVVAHHAKHEHRYCKVCWRFTPNITEDTMYMSFILFMGYPGIRHGLKFLSGRFMLLPPWEEKIHRYVELYKSMKRPKIIDEEKIAKWREDFPDIEFTNEEAYRWFDILKNRDYYIRQAESDSSDVFMWLVPTRVMEKYAGMDAVAPLQLMKALKPLIESDEGLNSCYNMIVKAAEVFANIELRGVRLQDRQRWIDIYHQHLDAALEKIRTYPEVKQLELEMTQADKKGTPQIFNPGSAQQTKKLFFEKFRFPVKQTTGKGEPSTGETVIIDLIKEYREKEDPDSKRKAEFLFKFREYKKLNKLLSAYFEGLDRFAHMNDSFDGFNHEFLPSPKEVPDEVIHPGYTIHGTVTGRLSSQDPSLHTIPYRSDVKKMVVPHRYKRGGIYVMADQSQLEIRVLACVIERYYGDSSLAQAYREGRDIHRFNASKIFLRPEEEIVDAERRFAKTISFSLLYGASEHSVAESTGRTPDEVHQLFEQFYASFPGIKAYIDASHQYVSQYGCVRTPLGRVKYLLGGLNPSDRKAYSDAMRQAQNAIIQSSGSDLSLRSINYMSDYLKENKMDSRIVGFIHDSIELDAAPGEWIECLRLLKYAMKDYNEALDWVTCPLKIDCSLSDNLGDETTVGEITDNPDGSHTFTIKGYDYLLDGIIEEAEFSYEILENEIISSKEFFEDSGDLIARKAMSMAFENKTFIEQERRITLKKKSEYCSN